MDPEPFEDLVRRALDTLPDEIARQIDNVDIVVQDWPDPAQLESARIGAGSTLLGLYQGIPLTKRSHWYNMVAPDRIIIFRGPIERISRNEDDLVERVREVVVHEVAHHFGISDARLAEIERERRAR